MEIFKKMKRLHSCLLTTLCCFTFLAAQAQSDYYETVFDGPFIENDTLFLRKVDCYWEGKYQYTNKLYIEPTQDKDIYHKKLFCTIYHSDSIEIKKSIDKLAQKYKLPEYSKTGAPNGAFVPLHKYNGKYYVYSPQQGPWEGFRIIAGQYLMVITFDGPYPFGITEMTQTSPTSWHIQANADPYENGFITPPYADLDIYLIDADKGIYLWHSHGKEWSEYELVVDIEHATDFDMIVWDTIELTDEFDEFETINYRKILMQGSLEP